MYVPCNGIVTCLCMVTSSKTIDDAPISSIRLNENTHHARYCKIRNFFQCYTFPQYYISIYYVYVGIIIRNFWHLSSYFPY